jgi:flavin-dependent dehydrogenase
MTSARPQVLIVGAGFGGLTVARELANSNGVHRSRLKTLLQSARRARLAHECDAVPNISRGHKWHSPCIAKTNNRNRE